MRMETNDKKSLLFRVSLGIIISFFLFVQCDRDLECDEAGLDSIEESGVKINEYGFLSFSSQEIFDSYVKNIDKDESSSLKSLVTFPCCSLFKSINYHKKAAINDAFLKSAVDDDIDEEELSVDEYNLSIAESIVRDELLYDFLDTTLRIGIGDYIYKITEDGTFAFKSSIYSTNYCDSILRDFDSSKYNYLNVGEYVELSNEVLYIKSFDKYACSEEVLMPEESFVGNKSVSNDLHGKYNVKTYKWKSNSKFQKLMAKIFGKDVKAEVNFNSKRRLQLEVFNVNYLFYASSGLKVNMQKRKKFLGIKRWVSSTAEEIVVGFNELAGEAKISGYSRVNSIYLSEMDSWNRFYQKLNNVSAYYIYGLYDKMPYVKGWANKIVLFLPEISVFNYSVYDKTSIANALYQLPSDMIVGFLKNQVGRRVNGLISNSIVKETPRGYIVVNANNKQFNKLEQYILGVHSYYNCSSQTIRFDKSYGLKVTNGSIGGFVTSEYDIKKLDIFVAAKYFDEWKGIRMINE